MPLSCKIDISPSSRPQAASSSGRDPAQRSRPESEEISCPAKGPRLQAGVLAKRGVSELVRVALKDLWKSSNISGLQVAVKAFILTTSQLLYP